MTSTIAPLLGGLFLVLAVGALLRRRGTGAHDVDALYRVIMDATLPALVLHILWTRDLVWRAGFALLSSTVALFVAGGAALLLAKLVRAERPKQGALSLTSAFSNTSFLGFPLIVAVFPKDGTASSTALIIDTFDTTLILWTVGIALAQRLGSGTADGGWRAQLKETASAFARPVTAALVAGVLLRVLHAPLPGFLDGALSTLGNCTTPLVFLALGLQLDPRAIAGRAPLVAAGTVLKLAVAPLVALGLVRLLRVDEPAASVAVLQAGMPSAMASVIVTARTGCDRSLGAGVATLSTLLCVLSLPALAWLLDVTR